jgi:SAM-dependent methyltransferase
MALEEHGACRHAPGRRMMAQRLGPLERFYPEVALGGFSRDDGSVAFYTRIAALLRSDFHVLDYGAGRGGQIETDDAPYRRWLKSLKGRVAHLEGCDVDPVVLQNPFLDHASLLPPDGALPYANECFDLILANFVFEHIADEKAAADELLRVLKPGGIICAITPNKWGYVAIAARLAGNSRHVRWLRHIQPDRAAPDVFPTSYRLNTKRALRRAFAGSTVVMVGHSAEPAYHFGSTLVFFIFKVIHKLLPEALATAWHIFIRKPAGRSGV